jgi:hypothetical protein
VDTATNAQRGLAALESHGCIYGIDPADRRELAVRLVTDVLHGLASEGVEWMTLEREAARLFWAERRKEG